MSTLLTLYVLCHKLNMPPQIYVLLRLKVWWPRFNSLKRVAGNDSLASPQSVRSSLCLDSLCSGLKDALLRSPRSVWGFAGFSAFVLDLDGGSYRIRCWRIAAVSSAEHRVSVESREGIMIFYCSVSFKLELIGKGRGVLKHVKKRPSQEKD